MIHLARNENFFPYPLQALVQHESDHVLIFRRGGLVFAFNFHPEQSFTDYRFEAPAGKYVTLLDSDAEPFHGFARVNSEVAHLTIHENEKNYLQLYLPNRTALVLKQLLPPS
jgi:1,4-alpha-glucan branching enzyme